VEKIKQRHKNKRREENQSRDEKSNPRGKNKSRKLFSELSGFFMC
jgi:hypothetical protein